MERVAEYYFVSGDEHAKVVLDRWIDWAKSNTKIGADGSYEVPGDLDWSGQPSTDWNDARQNFDPKDKTYNSGLHVKIMNRGPDVGTAAGLAQTLTFYAKKSGDAASAKLA